ncbi:DNA-binding protein snt1 [Coemansia sp. RSA 1813]|nr:DNA-binding protein snt1 [Coemansia sp. RSA 1813]
MVVPRQELHSRISDIDREIAECQERLVMISGSSLQADSAGANVKSESSDAEKQRLLVTNDRAVPTLPTSPHKPAVTSVGDIVSKPAGPAVSASLYTDSDITMQGGTFVDSLAPVVPQSSVASDKSDRVDKDGLNNPSNWPAYKSPDSQALFKDGNAVDSDSGSDSEEDDLLEEHPPKDRLKSLFGEIYRENQIKAAEMQAKLAAPFLESFPTFVPGSYPSPTDWPFWEDNVKIHEKVRPHLDKILARERNQSKNHACRLQEEYSELYSKWRKRVDKLDRQREAKQKSMIGGTATGGGSSGSGGTGSSGSTQSGSSFASTSNRRRHVSGSSNPTTDEFGFSLGPLFSASANVTLTSEAAGRVDDYFLSDAVHSEAELQAIIERLQHDDARNPDIRSQRTAAIIPNMAIDPKERERLRFNNNSHLIADPVAFYHVQLPEPGTNEHRRIAYANNGDSNHYWTQSEVSTFVAAYLTHPKQFGKIASYIPYKTMNDCVLFYYRNKKQLRLKELETKSNKRVRRSRVTGASSGGAGGRKRKERARERRERRAREEREKLAQEAAAGCAPMEYLVDVSGIAAAAYDGQTTNVRTSAFPSDDEESNNAVGCDTKGTLEFSPEQIDVLERRSKSSALLRSIIAANRQRKHQTAIDGPALLGFGNSAASDDSSAPLLSPMNDGDDDDDVEDESPTSATAPAALPISSKRSRHKNGFVSSGKSRRRSSETPNGAYSASGPLSPVSPSIPVSATDSRSRQTDDEEDGESASVYAGGSRGAAADEVEEGEERGSLHTEASGHINTSNSEDDDGEEEGELVEDSHWEPQPRSRLYMELAAYAMGGSIVRTRRGRELERERFGGDANGYGSGSGGSDDELGAYSERRDRKPSPADLSYDEEDEIVEASGIVGGRFQPAGKGVVSGRASAGLKQQPSRPRIVSRRSQSRFGATLTAVLDPDDSRRTPTAAENGSDASAESSLYLLHRQPSHQRPGPPKSPSAAGDPPKESALDRYVADGASELKRPISSYEALFMCSPVSSAVGASVVSPVRGTCILPESDSGVGSTVDPGSSSLSFNSQRQLHLSSSPSPPGKRRLSSATGPTASSKKQLEVQIEEEAGPQNSVLVGAAAWLCDDRKRVLRGFHKLGPDFAQVASLMPSKTMAQCRYFYYHYRTPAGILLSEIIPNSLSLATASAHAHSSDSKYGNAQPGLGSLVLPQIGQQATTITSRVSHSGTQRHGSIKGRPTTARVDLPATQVVSKSSAAVGGSGVKRQRTKSPVSHPNSSSDDEDDETPLAAQLAEALAAQAVAEGHSHPGTPILDATAPAGVNTLAMQQRRASDLIAQVRPELINPRVMPISSLMLPPKASSAGASGELAPGVKGTSSQPLLGSRKPSSKAMPGYGQYLGVGGNSGIHGVGRTPSPHAAMPQTGGTPMTAKKSGYSSYWSVHERSAFMHYVVRIGPDWPTLAEAVGSKTGTQVRNYFRANREKLGLDAVITEYEKNKAAGTLPPMTPFQPVSAASASSQSGQSPASAISGSATTGLGDDNGVKKEKRGRKRKNERLGSPKSLAMMPSGSSSASVGGSGMPSDSIPLSQINRGNSMAGAVISPGSASGMLSAHASQTLSAPNTAPATMTSFPTIGIDGGRAVVYKRPLAPAGSHPQQSQAHAFATQPPLPFAQSRVAGRVADNMAVDRGNSVESGERPSVIVRAESDTVSSQATPPPVEGLPRLSSSPAPGYGALHISNLTTAASGPQPAVSGFRRTGTAYDPVRSAAGSATESYRHQSTGSSGDNREKREVRVTKINALLNDESPTETPSTLATDWFGTSVKEDVDSSHPGVETTAPGYNKGKSSEEEATGIAALALAAMMGAGRTPPTSTAPTMSQQHQPKHQPEVALHPQHMHPQQQQQQQQQQARHSLSIMQPTRQQQPFAEQPQHRFHPRQSPMLPHRLPDAYTTGNAGVSSVSASAFSPIVATRGSPMTSPPPMAHHQTHVVYQQHQHPYHHLQARPSSVGPVSTYHPQHNSVHSAGGSPAIPYSREMSPQRVAVPISQGANAAAALRQRKPSAPPLPPINAGTYARGSGRSSISSNYTPYNIPQQQQQQQQQQQMPTVGGGHSSRVPYASPSMQQQLPAPVAAPMPISRAPQYPEGSQYNAAATGYVEMPQASMVAPHHHYQQHPQQQQQHPPPNSNPPPYR